MHWVIHSLPKCVIPTFISWHINLYEIIHCFNFMHLKVLVFPCMNTRVEKPRPKFILHFVSRPNAIIFCEIDTLLDVPGIYRDIFDILINNFIFLTFLFSFSIFFIKKVLITFSYLELIIFWNHCGWTSLKIKSMSIFFETWANKRVITIPRIEILFGLLIIPKIFLNTLPSINSFILIIIFKVTIIGIYLLITDINESFSIFEVQSSIII